MVFDQIGRLVYHYKFNNNVTYFIGGNGQFTCVIVCLKVLITVILISIW